MFSDHRGHLLTGTKILMGNIILYMACNVENAAGYWEGMRRKAWEEGESDGELGSWMDGNKGPFEPSGDDISSWIKYVDSKTEILRRKILDMENGLRSSDLTKINMISEEEGVRKVPEDKPEEITEKILKIDHHAIKQHLKVLRNWLVYLEGTRTNFNEKTPVDTIDGVMATLEKTENFTDILKVMSQSSVTVPMNKVLNDRSNEDEAKSGAIPCSECQPCKDEKDDRISESLLQLKKKLASSHYDQHYRNISLDQIEHISKIVDFVDRYRGRFERLGTRKTKAAGKATETEIRGGGTAAEKMMG